MPFLGSQPAETALTTGDLADDIVTEAKMANDAIGLAELKAGTDGELITWDASGNPTTVGAGTSGHFLKSQGAGSVPVFAAAGGGSMTFISSVTASDSATVAFTSGIDTTYEEYIIKGVNIHSASDDVYFYAVAGTSGPSYLTTNEYDWRIDGANQGGTSGADNGSTLGRIGFHKDSGSGEMAGNATYEMMDVEFILRAPGATDNWKKFFIRTVHTQAASGQGIYVSTGGGQIRSSTAITAIKFQFSSGNISSGNFYLYGINKS
tara:strand:- start:1938 stop:2729 length:792 start_codon:yes stop_codon:yes gene_type:complete